MLIFLSVYRLSPLKSFFWDFLHRWQIKHLEKKEKRLKMKKRSRANNKQQSKSFQQLYVLALLMSEIYWFINPYQAMSAQTHYYSYRNHSTDAFIMILYSITYLDGSSQVHILERVRVEQECVSFHFSSA